MKESIILVRVGEKSVIWDHHLSRDIRFPTMWYVHPAKAQTSLYMVAGRKYHIVGNLMLRLINVQLFTGMLTSTQIKKHAGAALFAEVH